MGGRLNEKIQELILILSRHGLPIRLNTSATPFTARMDQRKIEMRWLLQAPALLLGHQALVLSKASGLGGEIIALLISSSFSLCHVGSHVRLSFFPLSYFNITITFLIF